MFLAQAYYISSNYCRFLLIAVQTSTPNKEFATRLMDDGQPVDIVYLEFTVVFDFNACVYGSANSLGSLWS